MATNKSQDDYQKQGVRIPKELHARIHEAAAESGRSYNSELIARLQASFEPATQNPEWETLVQERKVELRLSGVREDIVVQRKYIRLFERRIAALRESDPDSKLALAESTLANLKSELAVLEKSQTALLNESYEVSRRMGLNSQRVLKVIDKLINEELATETEAAGRRHHAIGRIAKEIGATKADVMVVEDEELTYQRTLREEYFSRMERDVGRRAPSDAIEDDPPGPAIVLPGDDAPRKRAPKK